MQIGSNTSKDTSSKFSRDTHPPKNVVLKINGEYSIEIPVVATASDDTSGIECYSFECKKVDDASWTPCETCNVSTNSQDYKYTLDAGCSYYLRCLVTDKAGNKAYSDGSNPDTGTGRQYTPTSSSKMYPASSFNLDRNSRKRLPH